MHRRKIATWNRHYRARVDAPGRSSNGVIEMAIGGNERERSFEDPREALQETIVAGIVIGLVVVVAIVGVIYFLM